MYYTGASFLINHEIFPVWNSKERQDFSSEDSRASWRKAIWGSMELSAATLQATQEIIFIGRQ